MKSYLGIIISILIGLQTLDVKAQDFKIEVDEFTDEKLILDEDWRVLYRSPNCIDSEPCYSMLQVKPAYIPHSEYNLIMLNFLSVSEEQKYNFDPISSFRVNKGQLTEIDAIINGKNKKTVKAGNYKSEVSNDFTTHLETFTVLIEFDDLLLLDPNNELKFRIKDNVIEFNKNDREYLKAFVSYIIKNR